MFHSGKLDTFFHPGDTWKTPLDLSEPIADGRTKYWGSPTAKNYYAPEEKSLVEQNRAWKELMRNEARHQAKKRVDHEKGVDVAGITRNKDFLMHRGSTRDSQCAGLYGNRSGKPMVVDYPKRGCRAMPPDTACDIPGCTVHTKPCWMRDQGGGGFAETFPQLQPHHGMSPSHQRPRTRSHKARSCRHESSIKESGRSLGSQFPAILRGLAAENAELLANCKMLAREVNSQNQRVAQFAK